MNEPRMRTRITLLSTTLVLALQGCAFGGAPSLSLFGAYFPSWLLCSIFAIIGAVLARAVFVVAGWADGMPYQLAVCTAIGLMVGSAAWLLWSGV